MSHRTGMPRWDSTWMVDSEHTLRHRTRSLRYLPLSKPPRTTFQYCNLMFMVISHVIETVTGQWLGDFLRIHIYEPLDMTSTFLSLTDARNTSNTVAHGYYWSSRTQDYEEVSYIDRRDFSGAGGTISNVLDYAKWLRMFLYQASPLSASAHSELLKPRTFLFEGVEPMFQQPAYALGWNVMVYRGIKFYTHDGGLPGFGTKVLMIPEKEWAFAIMGNTGETSNMVASVLGFRLVDQLLGVPERERFDWNASNQEALLASQKPFNKTAVLHSLYPHLPSPAIPASLPLSPYAHSYHHPAYGTITFSTHCTRHSESDFEMEMALGKSNYTLVSTPTSKVTIFLEHISGDHFVAWLSDRGAFKAEFDVDVKGVARRLGLDLEPKMEGEMLWFERVDAMSRVESRDSET
ncbi:hypothetical protein LTR16_000963 [Cryomyces antarcticus]|uniref:Beta-lactamase-related domain-containing protein n=1 Tax=Cryomyces antarcticus TaxID=329879 RepID=A0ABR0LQS5_9PEZI|nr:hypothetical protein LTR16_000963 [Cryomyces antarcticus]